MNDKSIRMKFHFIAIGGSIMHALAISLHKMGHEVTGSDDEIFEPSKSQLARYNILPGKTGWSPEKIHPQLDAVILGMHAREDNPELQKARGLHLNIYSFPEFLYEQTKHKKRVVIGGSHGKTTITSIIMHVLKYHGKPFDYIVGSQPEGFESLVELSNNTEIAVFEGDEYLSSTLDPRPKFHLYKPHIALINGISWDHINVFPTFENYVNQFTKLLPLIEPGGTLVYYREDETIRSILPNTPSSIRQIPYTIHPYQIKANKTYLVNDKSLVPVFLFGHHNMQNISGALSVCRLLGLSDEQFYEAIQSFKGTKKRLQILVENEHSTFFLDFAHAPSKLKATIHAVKGQFPERKLLACMELHTFSSLNPAFLSQYQDTMNEADEAIVFYNPRSLEMKKLPMLDPDQVKSAFGRKDIRVFNDPSALKAYFEAKKISGTNLLFMSSGNFSGFPLQEFAKNHF